MNELKLKEMNEKKVVYLYFPQGEEQAGEIEYSFDEKQAIIKKKAENDDTGYFGRKAQQKVEECVDKNNLPIKFIQAWY